MLDRCPVVSYIAPHESVGNAATPIGYMPESRWSEEVGRTAGRRLRICVCGDTGREKARNTPAQCDGIKAGDNGQENDSDEV